MSDNHRNPGHPRVVPRLLRPHHHRVGRPEVEKPGVRRKAEIVTREWWMVRNGNAVVLINWKQGRYEAARSASVVSQD